MESQRTFTKDQIKRMANIFDNAGQVVLASVIIPPLLGLFDARSSRVIILFIGMLTTVIFWWLSLKLERITS